MARSMRKGCEWDFVHNIIILSPLPQMFLHWSHLLIWFIKASWSFPHPHIYWGKERIEGKNLSVIPAKSYFSIFILAEGKK